ncbi:hypothetical protein [Pseudonocardia sp. GCM10023141]|uniref:hypothetical protein n=1 Tax=Pseudonocardia sp. GCM10023141 TaxID=3252653 RepID=UPI00360B647A
MWEPVGPLPASVYWRRRWVAAASTVLVIALAVLCVSALTAPKVPAGDGVTALAANRAALSAPQQVSPSPAAPEPVEGTVVQPQALSQVLSDALSSPGTAGPGPIVTPSSRGATAPDATASATPTATPAPPPTPPAGPTTTPPAATTTPPATPPATPAAVPEGRPDENARPAAAASPPPPSTGPVACTNPMIAASAEVDQPEHRLGDRVVLRLVIRNISGQPCFRDLDGQRQEVVVWSNDLATRLWSSNDCANPSNPDLRTLVPGQPVVFSVTWAGGTTTPGCVAPRKAVPAGPYRVMTRLDDVISAPVPLTLTP